MAGNERPALPDSLHGAGGIGLEARWDLPPDPRGPVVVLCHPHPLYGGTMSVPLLRTVAARLAGAGCPVLRFNFRGVGASGGSWSGGEAEAEDVAAAAAAAGRRLPPPASGPGGMVVRRGGRPALAGPGRRGRAVRRHRPAGAARTWSPPLPPPETLPPARRLFLIGDRDQFTPVEDLSAYAAAAGADLLVLPGSDHFFFGREGRVAEAVAAHLTAAGA